MGLKGYLEIALAKKNRGLRKRIEGLVYEMNLREENKKVKEYINEKEEINQNFS